ncbi:nitroreductase family protein [Marinomonas sp. MED121]|nr:nitroreductase family protein [Marinomonas sp. MED121]
MAQVNVNMKEFIQFMRERSSQNALLSPAPLKEEWQSVLEAASRAADHGAIKPWRYRIYSGKSLDLLGECYWQHALASTPEMPISKKDNFIQKAHRAPAVLLVTAALVEEAKVPKIEQTMAVAAATQQVLLGLEALGYGAIWRTGPVAHSQLTKSILGIEDHHQVIGFVYVGTAKALDKRVKEVDLTGHIEWFE